MFRASGGEPASASGAHPPCSGVPVLQSVAAAHVTSTPHLAVAHHDHRAGENWTSLTTDCLSLTVPSCVPLHILTYSHTVIHSTSVSLQVQVFLLMEQELTADEDISRYVICGYNKLDCSSE